MIRSFLLKALIIIVLAGCSSPQPRMSRSADSHIDNREREKIPLNIAYVVKEKQIKFYPIDKRYTEKKMKLDDMFTKKSLRNDYIDIITICNGCFGTLKDINVHLKEDEEARAKVNAKLKLLGDYE